MAKRNAVVVTHTRLRQTGTVVAEAVSQLRVAGFEVTIIDNTEAPDFGVQPPCVSDDTEIVVVLGGDGTILRAAELVHCTQVPILGNNLAGVRRYMTPAECAALQSLESISLPEGDLRAYKALGNAVNAAVVHAIAEPLLHDYRAAKIYAETL